LFRDFIGAAIEQRKNR